MSSGISKALNVLGSLPRVNLGNLRPLVPSLNKRSRQGRHGGIKCGRGNKGQSQRNTLPPIGFIPFNGGFTITIPKEDYYKDVNLKREYPPLSLLFLQRLIDLGRLDPNKFIDLTTLCNTNVVKVIPAQRHYGINLIDEGSDIFKAKVNIEVQWASEATIAAIERNGGVIKTRFFDIQCMEAMVDPQKHFRRGLVIPKCQLPPQDLVEYYSNANNRGYLADPQKVAEARLALSQKYGYVLEDITKNEVMLKAKDPRQIWYGLEPGWVVNLTDKCIIKPTNEELIKYYKS